MAGIERVPHGSTGGADQFAGGAASFLGVGVILSAAKNLHNGREILRCAQNDNALARRNLELLKSHRERRHGGADAAVLGEDVRTHPAVLHLNRPFGQPAERRVVRNQHDGHSPLFVEMGEQFKHALRRM